MRSLPPQGGYRAGKTVFAGLTQKARQLRVGARVRAGRLLSAGWLAQNFWLLLFKLTARRLPETGTADNPAGFLFWEILTFEFFARWHEFLF